MIIPKEKVYDFLKAVLLMTFIPTGFFILITIIFKINLNPIVYPIASITGFCIVLTTLLGKILRSEATKNIKAVSFIILMIISPVVSIIIFSQITLMVTHVGLTTENLAEAIFCWVFGICVVFGFTYLLPTKFRD